MFLRLAVSGGRKGMSLEMRDSLEFAANTIPILTLKTGEIPHIGTSKWTFSADLMLDARKPVSFVIEFRCRDPKKRFSPIIVNPNGIVHTRGKTTAELCKVEPGKWWTFSLTYDLNSPETHEIDVKDAAGSVIGERSMENMPGMGGITWVGLVGYTKAEGSFYVDNMKLLPLDSEPVSKMNKPPPPTAIEPTFKDAKYGAHDKELMNFWQAESDQRLGVLLNIHGGGWMGGAKAETMHRNHLSPGYHQTSISYPLVNEGAVQPAMLNAALRAVQFLRYKAEDWNIDPQRIVVTGGSAGGCSNLLVALHDDVADPQSADPVERFSSRVAGAIVAGAQTTMNPFVIKERIGEKTFGNPMPYKPFGAETVEELMANWDKHRDLVLTCSPVTHVSPDDPPLHLFYNVNREFPTTKAPNGIHSPIFGEIMLEACKEKGVECYLQYWEKDRPKPAVSRQEFLDRLLLK